MWLELANNNHHATNLHRQQFYYAPKEVVASAANPRRRRRRRSVRFADEPDTSPREEEQKKQDWSLVRNQLFAYRFIVAAIDIQRVFRGYVQRSTTSLLNPHVAATKIQCAFRCWMSSMITRIVALEKGIEIIENRRQRRLERIANWKAGTKAQLDKQRQLVMSSSSRSNNSDEALKEQLRLNREEIKVLRHRYDDHMKKSQQLKSELKKLVTEKGHLSDACDVFNSFTSFVTQALSAVNQEFTQWQHVTGLYEKRAKVYRRVIGKLEQKVLMERTRNSMYQRSASQLVTLVMLKDDELFDELEEEGLTLGVQRRFSRRRSFDIRCLRRRNSLAS